MDSCHCSTWMALSACRVYLENGKTPMPTQRRLAHLVAPGAKIVYIGCRQGSGKTESSACAIVGMSLALGGAPGSVITSAIAAPSERAGVEAVARCKSLVQGMGIEITRDNLTHLEFRVGKGTARCLALPAAAANIRGLTINGVLLLEECQGLAPDVLAACLPFVGVGGGAIIAVGTGTAPTGVLWDLWSNPAWVHLRLDGYEADSYGRFTTSGYLQDQKQLLGDLAFRREYLAEFVSAEGALLSAEDIHRAADRGADVVSAFAGVEL
jgi:hypothetical protein